MKENAMDPLAAIGCQDDADIRLDLAALELAAADRVRADLAAPIAYIESLAGRLEAPISGSAARAEALAGLLAREEHFTGDAEAYDAPRNADLLHVLERRRGLPIALAILYVALARRVGWQARVLGMPGHVLVAVGGEADMALIDAFHHGRIVDAATLPPASGREIALLDNRETLVRLLANQATRARQAGDDARALTLYRRLTLIAPTLPALWWERARLERLAGDKEAARRSLAAMRETTHDPELETRIRAAYEALAR
ncbi:transglutaminase-like domain-containing protein [Sandaracinobacteroides hominis]|uniref:transglutaminase-like domain-containing protein n=1 Tax=Sandaracinobacteroides hominis TaxID=2780086 RepID=UPI002E2E5F37|nr:transglutaminase-like domain-containing protein [Sandaracinobacteroides hominis]